MVNKNNNLEKRQRRVIGKAMFGAAIPPIALGVGAVALGRPLIAALGIGSGAALILGSRAIRRNKKNKRK